MTTDPMDSLRNVHIFRNLDNSDLILLARQCTFWKVAPGHVIFEEGDDGDRLYIIHDGTVQVAIATRRPDGQIAPSTINVLTKGQSFGEMVLLDGVTRSATVTALDPALLLVLRKVDFDRLCTDYPHIGYTIMRQIASDLAYKLRASNLLLRGQIRWQHNELLPTPQVTAALSAYGEE